MVTNGSPTISHRSSGTNRPTRLSTSARTNSGGSRTATVEQGERLDPKSGRPQGVMDLSAANFEQHAPSLRLALERIFEDHKLDLSGVDQSSITTIDGASKAMASISKSIQASNLDEVAGASLKEALVSAYSDFYRNGMGMSIELARKSANKVVTALLRGPEAVERMFRAIDKVEGARAGAERALKLINQTDAFKVSLLETTKKVDPRVARTNTLALTL